MNSGLLDLYSKISSGFRGDIEQVSVNYSQTFDNADTCLKSGLDLFNAVKNEVTIKRLENEKNFHSYLVSQLFTRLQEIKSYSTVDINNTRRLIAVSHECISTIHVLIRDDINVNVYFRSSDFAGALPADLKFISEIPLRLIKHLTQFKNQKGYEEANNNCINNLKNKQIKLNLTFGSLHKINYELQ